MNEDLEWDVTEERIENEVVNAVPEVVTYSAIAYAAWAMWS